ncbi:hypothetical protein [Massilia sp. YMA4]|uniref:PAS domain-containing protein n=1 Tax=[Empedobacter] haloabium TaxID=592317 RepID=A0ABZ1UHT1_9BURK|nr:hypothetical protein [Massilia sp. YMA4]AXA94221.1 hypothetical protein DPH57_25655 [Massilia sp. YMA4]
MFKKLFASFGARKALPGAAARPYKSEELDLVYQLLFCDDPDLVKATPVQASLFGATPDPRVVQTIGEDAGEESRVRLLAWHWLRSSGQPFASREVLGIVVEVPLEEGLDALAAYADGSVRYINHTGRVAVFEGAPAEVAEQGKRLVHTAIALAVRAPVKQRMAPPALGAVRFSLLAADGLHVREGTFAEIARDKLTGPVLQEAQRLLDTVVKQGT